MVPVWDSRAPSPLARGGRCAIQTIVPSTAKKQRTDILLILHTPLDPRQAALNLPTGSRPVCLQTTLSWRRNNMEMGLGFGGSSPPPPNSSSSGSADLSLRGVIRHWGKLERKPRFLKENIQPISQRIPTICMATLITSF